MQKPVHDVQLDLVHQRITKFARVPSRGVDADKNFAVVKSYDVRWPSYAEKLAMQSRHASIGNEPHKNFVKLAQVTLVSFSQSQATLHGVCCKRFKLANIDQDFSLKIPYGDVRRFCPSIHSFVTFLFCRDRIRTAKTRRCTANKGSIGNRVRCPRHGDRSYQFVIVMWRAKEAESPAYENDNSAIQKFDKPLIFPARFTAHNEAEDKLNVIFSAFLVCPLVPGGQCPQLCDP